MKRSAMWRALVFAAFAGAAHAQAPIPEFARMQVLLSQAEEAIARGDEKSALQRLSEMNALKNVKRPSSTYILEARLAGRASDWPRTMTILETYFRVASQDDPDLKTAADLYAAAGSRKVEAEARIVAEKVAAEAAATTRKPDKAFEAARTGKPFWERTFHDRMSNGDLGPLMVALPLGSFVMGSPETEEGRDSDEGPQRTVSISNPMAVGRYEVTWNEYARCVVAGGCTPASDDGFGGGDRPVTNVSWKEANRYAQWLSEQTGQPYRLLSEAEWEYAARAGTATPFSTGSTISSEQGNFDGAWFAAPGKAGIFRRATTPVGSFSANNFGLHDMHGNANEWVQNCYTESQRRDAHTVEQAGCDFHVYRGGSWAAYAQQIRSANRFRTLDVRMNTIGFRVARTLRQGTVSP